jgi:protein TonB
LQKKREVKKEIPKKTEPRPSQQKEVTPNYANLNPTKLQKDTLEDYLLTPVKDVKLLDKLTQEYIKLYGDEYNTFTKIQKVFLQKNLNSINQILHQYYRFPDIALRLRKSDKNIVEFTLHPNGDITDLKIKENSNYSFYDKSILETIEIAYKDFPRPKEPTKIIIRVTYTIY